jgi:hypothetical protein
MVVIPQNEWLPVASALSAFWTNGEGPSAPNIREAIGAAGIEYEDVKGANKKDTIANSVQRSSPLLKKKVVTELVGLLAAESHFQQGTSWYQPKKVEKLQSTLQAVGCSLREDGFTRWTDQCSDEKPLLAPQPPAAEPTLTLPSSPVISSPSAETAWGPSLETLLKVLRELPAAASSLTGARRKGKVSVEVRDEYDVQDFMKMALLMLYKDVRAEEVGASFAGVSSRVDFFIKQEQVVVEAKVAYKKHANKVLSDELLIDIARYSKRPGLKDLVCVVYDLDGSLDNPAGFADDLEEHKVGSLRVHVVAAIWPFSARPPAATAAASGSESDTLAGIQ